ncbi:Por secretion system C-terminal sorting domain-containing protein [Chitinophaga eiseniae]|uniref:Por secretion system C-terminal sorting domain-containing protein n=1 Tax=Chitinophaga eiseniae TaxID=634771 RepID=A0A1T4T998_9BACT|nr:T9SS type A sorting domain-containing protein [Chitinophaga eiseniae]SKA36881.1 Por secretion system C-terminal sorting domain-containing protein [Chitinophaga eiseniae]
MKIFSHLFNSILLLSLLIFPSISHGQTVYANSQSNSITGLCLLCSINNPNNAVDTDHTNYSEFMVPVELLNAKLSQTLIFPSTGSAGCDSLIIKVASTYSLSASAFSNIIVRTYNGGDANSDSISPSPAQIHILPDNTQAEILLRPTQSFDRVMITYNVGLAGLLGNFRIYYALRKQSLPAPATIPAKDTTICQGNTAIIRPFPNANTIYRWYDAATGGNLILSDSGDYSVSVNPSTTTTYYVEGESGGCISQRTPVKVLVTPRPANPVYSVPQSIACGNTAISVSNYQPGINYNVRLKYSGLFGLIKDTSYTVTNGGVVNVADIAYFFNANVDVYLQAVNALTGCQSDSVHMTFSIGGHATYVALDADSIIVCKGDSVTFHAFIHDDPGDDIAIIRWYDAPSGGQLLGTGKYFKVSPSITTTYYVAAAYQCEYPVRVPATAVVRKLPDPVYTVPQGMVCGRQTLTVQNHQAGFNYYVHILYKNFSGIFLDTAYQITNSSDITTPAFLPPVPSQVDVSVQAVDPVSGCRSDTIYKSYNMGGSSQLPSVDADSINICLNDSTTLHAFVPVFTLSIIRWYDAPIGGNLLFTGNYFKVSPPTSTTYYASAGYECEYPVRKPVKVIVSQCLSVRKTAVTSTESLECYPNPTSGQLQIRHKESLEGSIIRIHDLQGKPVYQSVLKANYIQLPASMSTGTYIIQLRIKTGKILIGKVIINK